jgi:hypothetical protein
MDAAAPIFVGEVATDGGDRISLPARGIRELGWEPGDQLLVQLVSEDMVLLMRRPRGSAGRSAHVGPAPEQMSERVGEPRTISGGDAERASMDAPAYGMAALPAAEVAAAPESPPAASDRAATAPAELEGLVESLASRVAALEQLLTREPAGAESAGPANASPEEMAADHQTTEGAKGPDGERDADAPATREPADLGEQSQAPAPEPAESSPGADPREYLLALRSLLAAGIERIDAMRG